MESNFMADSIRIAGPTYKERVVNLRHQIRQANPVMNPKNAN